MVDLVKQLRDVKDRDFHPDSLRTMVLWGADEIERLRTVLKECADDLAAAIEERYPLSQGDMPGRDAYPTMQYRYKRDMAPVVAARRLLNSEQRGQP